CGLGVQVLFGAPRFVDAHTVEMDGKRYTSKNWTIATGSSSSVPPISGLDQVAYLTHKELFYLDRLPASMIVLGAGPIGIEMAQAFNRLGCKVDVVDRAGQILVKEDQDMAEVVMSVLQSEGVRFHLNAVIDTVGQQGNEKQVHITDPNGRQTMLKGESILVAMGRNPNIEGLGLEAAGVNTQHSGIIVNQRLKTSQKHIYAAGDVNGGYQFTHAAGYEGGIVVSNAIIHLPRSTDYTYLPWCTYTDPELASIGMNEKAAQHAGLKIRVWTEAFKNNDRSLAEGETAGYIKLVLDHKEKPLGVQIAGLHAGELIGEWVAALNAKTKLSTLAAAVHPYPTIGEISKKVTGSVFSPKIFSDTMRKGLKLFFNLKGRACTLPEEASGQ
ncbi:MAG: FAD-dependent oxidoreductase, partial [Desulfatitalea sp.]|nr:FAD-dependent oxidoreductase [Desulfatitalea sp.]